MMEYNEDRLRERLDSLAVRARVVYALLCAERLLPTYELSRGASKEPAKTIDRLWDYCSGEQLDPAVRNEMREVSDEAINRVGTFDPHNPYAEDAIAAIAFAVRTMLSGDAQEALWAGRRVYECLDQYVINELKIDIAEPGAEEKVASQPIIQAEISYQLEDLGVLRGMTERDLHSALGNLRSVARARAYSFSAPIFT